MTSTRIRLNKSAIQILVNAYDSCAITSEEFYIGEDPTRKLITMAFIDHSLTESQIRDLNHLAALMNKNQSVFDGLLITEAEYLKNIRIIYFKFQKKAVSITNPKRKVANRLDVHSLRAHLQNIDNEN